MRTGWSTRAKAAAGRLEDERPAPQPRTPPGPRGARFIGNIDAYERDRLGFLTSCARTYGGVVRFSDDLYLVSDAELVHFVLMHTNDELASTSDFMREHVDGSKGSPDLARWMNSRRAAMKGLNRAAAAARAPELSVTIDELLDGWRAGEQIDVVAEMERLASRLIADYCLGPAAGAVSTQANEMFAALLPISSSAFKFPRWLPISRNQRVRRKLAAFESAVRAGLRDAHGTGGAPRLGEILTAAGLDEDDASRTVRATLLAHGVTAAALSWIWLLLAEHPETARRIHREVRDVVARVPLTAHDVERLTFTQAVVKEALRLYPPSWLGVREVDAPIELGGYPLRPGQYVMYSPYVVQRDPRYFRDPEEFRPERWLGEETRALPRGAYFPFGGGPRICVGYGLAAVELAVATALVVRRFRVDVDDPGSVRPDTRRLLIPDGLRATVRLQPTLA